MMHRPLIVTDPKKVVYKAITDTFHPANRTQFAPTVEGQKPVGKVTDYKVLFAR